MYTHICIADSTHRPYLGVFKETVSWCLVVTTPREAILCALSRTESALRLIPTRYTIPTDNVPILSVGGTPDGRIFLGGIDGSLYEMVYESSAPTESMIKTTEQKWNDFYDEDQAKPDMHQSSITLTGQILTNSKRAFSSMMIGSSRPRKCRKLNHSQSATSSVISAIIPDFVLKASSSLLWSSDMPTGGITKIVIDSERSCVYTLSAKGWICSYDLRDGLKLTSQINAEKTARLYLGAVSRGHMNPPPSSNNTATIAFPGGGSSAQSGVGGMDGARLILKLADNSMQSSGGRGQTVKQQTNILTPTSIHVISRHESSRLTLIAVTAGGLRYYLSSLSPSVLNSGPGVQHRKGDPLAPSATFTMCHIRAPPPVDSSGALADTPSYDSDISGVVDGLIPRLGGLSNAGIRVDAAHYRDGVTFLAIERKGIESTGAPGYAESVGNMIVAVTPDAVARKIFLNENNGNAEIPGGVSEALSMPLSSESATSGVLPGGQIMDANSVLTVPNLLMKLIMNSQTPSDGDLSNGLAPPYIPQSILRQSEKAKNTLQNVSHSALELASSAQVGAIVRSNGSSASASSIAFTIMSNFLLSRPLRQGLTNQNSFLRSFGTGSVSAPHFRISKRYGCTGFSNSAGGNVSSDNQLSVGSFSKGDSNKSARLSPWLLKPAIVPLNQFALHHLTIPHSIVALNAGGTHYFKPTSILKSLADALMSSGTNVGNDDIVSTFFTRYGYRQGCAMCLILAIGCGPASGNGAYSDELRHRATRAALSRAFVPTLVHNSESSGQSVDIRITETQTDPAIPTGYKFKPSCLSEGLTSVASRLLRPIWYKPAVVVTEGPKFRSTSGATQKILPSKVELLLDDASLEAVRQPLVALQNLMREVLAPAVNVVPGADIHDANNMDVDNFGSGQDLFITGTMLYQHQLRAKNGVAASGQLSHRDSEEIARLLEERSLHSLFRLVSRNVQLLSLLSLLKRAQFMPDLPDVEWGLLHGVSVSQLVQTCEGQERIDILLNAFVSSNKALLVKPAAEADQLANLLATQCYLYYSPGSMFAFLGFRDANEALSCTPSSARRTALTNQAVVHLKRAASFWCSAPMITGRTMQNKDNGTYAAMALGAMENDSPLAKAAMKLYQLEDVVALVDICLMTAANFSGKDDFINIAERGEDNNIGITLKWEHGLYHKRRRESHNNGTSASSLSTLVVGTKVTQSNALNTCYAIILNHLITLLQSQNTFLADKMVSACAAASDKVFLQAFFEHLKVSDQSQTLIRIKSKELEHWLQRNDVGMLYRYYVVHGQHDEAGKLMWTQANMQGDVSFDQRLEWLTKARNSCNAALTVLNDLSPGNLREMKTFATLVEESVDVAQLQKGVLNSISSTCIAGQLTTDKLTKLKTTLVTVSDLYNEYAAPLNLFDSCLFIRHACRENDVYTLTLWRSVICEEVLPCATRSQVAFSFLQQLSEESLVKEEIIILTDDRQSSGNLPLFEHGLWVDKLKLRVISLGKELFGKGANYVCPVHFLAARLEELRHTQQNILPPSELVSRMSPWPLQTLVQIGVPFSDLLTAYEAIVVEEEKNLMGGANPRSRFLHLRSIVELLENWLLSASHEGPAIIDLSSTFASGMLLTSIDTAKADLEDLMGAGTEDLVKRVYERLLSTEICIKRLV